jgi:microfibrillar-associated protein 1
MAASSKPKGRYWPGKVPEYAINTWEEEEEEAFNLLPTRSVPKPVAPPGEKLGGQQASSEGKKNSPVRHLESNSNVKQQTERNMESAAERRARIKAQVLHKRRAEPDLLDRPSGIEFDSVKEIQEFRDRKETQQEVSKRVLEPSQSPSTSSLEEDQEETDGSVVSSEDEAEEDAAIEFPRLCRPVFVNKNQRGTIEEREKLEMEAERENAARESRKEFRKQQAHAVVTQASSNASTVSSRGDVDLDDLGLELPDDEDREAEYELEFMKWKIRELRRLHKEHERDEERKKELEEIERRRNMSEEERRKEDEERLRRDEKAREEKPKMAFLQKYYHKGVFFMEQDESGRYKEDIYNRNFMEGTEEDLIDRTYLPKVMQTRRGQFGFKGRTKYTHLTNEDTTFGTTYGNKKPDLTRDEIELIRKRKASELKGADSVFERPRGPKKA